MNKMFRFTTLLVLSLMTLAGSSLAQTEMPSSVVGGGGQAMAGGSHAVRGTVGQTATGNAGSTSFTMEIGFWRNWSGLVTGVSDTPVFVWNLQQNHPNPFNPMTAISFSLPEASRVNLRVFNARGELVRTLLNEERPAGNHSRRWDGRDDRGSAVASGVYFARLESASGVLTQKMLLAR